MLVIGDINLSTSIFNAPLFVSLSKKDEKYSMNGVKIVMSFDPMIRRAPCHLSVSVASLVSVVPANLSIMPEYLVSMILISASNVSLALLINDPPASNLMPCAANIDLDKPNMESCSMSGKLPAANLPNRLTRLLRCSSSAPKAAPRLANRGSIASVFSPNASSCVAAVAS